MVNTVQTDYVRSRTFLTGVNHGGFNRTTPLATSSPVTRCQRFAQGGKSVAVGCAQRQSQTTGLRLLLPRRTRSLETPTFAVADFVRAMQKVGRRMASFPRILSIDDSKSCKQRCSSLFRGLSPSALAAYSFIGSLVHGPSSSLVQLRAADHRSRNRLHIWR